MNKASAIRVTEPRTFDKDLSIKLHPRKEGSFSIIKVRYHSLTVSLNGTHNGNFTAGVSHAKVKRRTFSTHTLLSSAHRERSAIFDRRLSQQDEYKGKERAYTASKLIYDGQKNCRT